MLRNHKQLKRSKSVLTNFLLQSVTIFCIGLSVCLPAPASAESSSSDAKEMRPAVLRPALDGQKKSSRLQTDILLLLSAMPKLDWGDHPHNAAQIEKLIASHQPQSGNILLSIIANPKHSFQRRAAQAFFLTWDLMDAQQIQTYVQSALRLTANRRERYPQGIAAAVAMGYHFPFGWGLWPEPGKPAFKAEDFKARTSLFLDGKAYGAPVASEGFSAGKLGIYTKNLGLGTHTVHSILDYEFVHRGVKKTGSVKSPLFRFEVVDASAPDEFLAPQNPEVDALVRESFQVAQTEDVVVGGHTTKDDKVIKRFKVHFPTWRLVRPLPVDLCFEAEAHVVGTGKVIEMDPVIVQRGRTWSGYFSERYVELVDNYSGVVHVKIVLKPSRALALSMIERDITQYYPGRIETGVLTITVEHF